MIQVTCGECRHEFEAPDTRAGMEVLCPPCGTRVKVPRPGEEQITEMLGIHPIEGAHSLGDEAACHPSPDPESNLVIEWHEVAVDTLDDGTRPFEPSFEDELRRSHLFRIGLALTIAFLAPIAGAPGHALAFPQFSAFPGMNLAGLVLLLPLIAGITVMALAKLGDPPLRGSVTLAAGASLFGLMLARGEARATVGESLSILPTSASLSSALVILGVFGLLISTRLRWYRPISRLAYAIGAVAAACYAFYLFSPVTGRMPVEEPLEMLRMDKLMGLGMLGHIGLMAAAAVLCLINFPGSLPPNAATKAGRAFLCLWGAVVVPVLALTLSAMSMSGSMSMSGMDMGSPAMLFLSSAAKFGVMYGGLVLLIPIGIADLLVGQP